MRSYSVIVADDEDLISNGISEIIKQKYSQLHVVAIFNNGQDLMKYINSHHVDIIISDIKMPRVTGLELAQYLYENQIFTQLILISGYREFKYALKAISYNVKSFITKPIDPNKLFAALDNAINQIDEYCNNAYSYTANVLLKWELKRRTAKDLSKGIKEEDVIKKIGFDCATNVAEIFLKLGNPQRHITAAVLQDICEMETDDVNIFVLSLKYPIATLLLMTKNNKPFEKTAMTQIEQIKSNLSYLCTCNCKIEHVYKSVEEYADRKNIDRLISEYDLYLIQGSDVDRKKWVENLPHVVEDKNIKAFLSAFYQRIGKKLRLDDKWYEQALFVCKTVSDLKNWIMRFDDMLIVNSTNHSFITNMIKEYVEQNFDKDISLQSVAKKMNMSASYITTIFKRETGQKFVDYLVEMRIRCAMTMLRETNKSINEISEAVGYQVVKYFRKRFKEFTGLSPSEYRIMQKEDENETKQSRG